MILTDEDKRWISAEIKAAGTDLETRISGEIKAVETRISAELDLRWIASAEHDFSSDHVDQDLQIEEIASRVTKLEQAMDQPHYRPGVRSFRLARSTRSG
jgi:hypothetical protein